MKYVDEFRDPALARKLLARIENRSTRTVRLMEFCGGHTHAIMRYGLRTLLPDTVDLRSGPGCPVCVTANADLDRAIALAQVPGLILTTFGDMVRVPGSTRSLQDAKAGGADVRMVYSTLDALGIARENPGRPVVFLGVGFETTAPTIAAALLQASEEGLENFSVLSLHKLTPPATRAILDSGEIALDGIIGPGHVTTIIGTDAWEFLPTEYSMPVAVAGFEPLDILRSVADLIDLIEDGQPGVANAYARSGPNLCGSMPLACLPLTLVRQKSTRAACAAMCCEGRCPHPSVPSLARAAHLPGPSALAWCRQREPVRPTISSDGSCYEQ
jgi:hydrogenase expression/formation protein HypD